MKLPPGVTPETAPMAEIIVAFRLPLRPIAKIMDAHHPGWVFIGIGAFQALSLIAVLGVGEAAGKQRMQAV